MIFDHVKNFEKYLVLHPKFQLVHEFALKNNLSTLDIGRHHIAADELFVIISEYQTKAIENIFWESHQQYIDIQLMINGIENIGFANINKMEKITEYNDTKDLIVWKGEGNFVALPTDYFAIFFPDDVHAPQLNWQDALKVKKAVFKVKV